MPIPIFEQITELAAKEIETKREKISPWSIFLSLVLIAILVTTGEFAFRDSNRIFNPSYADCHLPVSFKTVSFLQTTGSPQPSCDMRAYEGTKLMLHADLSVPLLLIGILIMLFIRWTRLSTPVRALLYSFSVFVLWMAARVLFETESFLVRHYPLYGKYAAFLTIALVCIALIIVIQQKLRKKPV